MIANSYFSKLNDALPVLERYWANRSPENRDAAATAISEPLIQMEQSAIRRLPRSFRTQLETWGCVTAYSQVAMKILNGPGKDGLGAFDSKKGNLAGWCWIMMKNQVQSEAKKANIFKKFKKKRNSLYGSTHAGDTEHTFDKISLCAWNRNSENCSDTQKKEILRQAMDVVLAREELEDHQAAFLSAIRNGDRPTLQDHSLEFGVTTSTLDRRRKVAVSKVLQTAHKIKDRLESENTVLVA